MCRMILSINFLRIDWTLVARLVNELKPVTESVKTDYTPTLAIPSDVTKREDV